MPRLVQEGQARLERGKERCGRRHQRRQVGEQRDGEPAEFGGVGGTPAAGGGGREVRLEKGGHLGVEEDAESGGGDVR
jgi:hypothetical protein